MERYFIGVDLGGTETKAGIYTAEGREIGVSSQALPLLSPCPGFANATWRRYGRRRARSFYSRCQRKILPRVRSMASVFLPMEKVCTWSTGKVSPYDTVLFPLILAHNNWSQAGKNKELTAKVITVVCNSSGHRTL